MNKRMIKLTIAILVVVIILLIAVLVRGTKYGADFMIIRGSENVQKQQTVDVENCSEINLLDYSGSNIEIQTTEDSKFKVVQTAYNKINDSEKFTIDRSGDKINIKCDTERRNFNLFNFRFNEKIYLYMPKSYEKDLSIKGSSGNTKFLSAIKLNQLKYTGHSGNIKSSDSIEAKEASFELSSGNIEIEKLKVNEYNIASHSGNVDINSISGSGKISARSGNIRISYEDIDEYSNVEASSGNVKLNVPSNLSFEFNGSCHSGNIHSNFNMNKDNDGKTASAKVGNEPYKKINVKTSSGDISIAK